MIGKKPTIRTSLRSAIVAGELMLAHKASHQGRVAVEILHGAPAKFEPLAIPAVVFTDPEIAWAGLTEDQAKKAGREIEVATYPGQRAAALRHSVAPRVLRK